MRLAHIRLERILLQSETYCNVRVPRLTFRQRVGNFFRRFM